MIWPCSLQPRPASSPYGCKVRGGRRVRGFTGASLFTGAPAAYLAGISDIELVDLGAGLRLYTATRAGGGLLAFSLSEGPGEVSLALRDALALPAGETLPAPLRLQATVIGGTRALLLSGHSDAVLEGVQLSGRGRFGAGLSSPADEAAEGLGEVAAQIYVETATGRFLYQHRIGAEAITGYALTGGSATALAPMALPGPFQGAGVAALQDVALAGGQYLLALAQASQGLRSYEIGTDGALREVASLGASAGLGLSAPSALEIVQSGGQSYAIVAGAGSSSLSVIALEAQGRMSLSDHVIDSRDTRFQNVSALTSFTVEGRPFLLAGGGDDGLSLLTLLPNGRLLYLGHQTRTASLPLDNLTALAAQVRGESVAVFAAGQGAGLMRLTLDLGPLNAPQIGDAGADLLTGGAAGDLLSGGLGNDTLKGGAGEDILMDGGGSDSLYGGTGADIFVMSADAHGDVIRDYQPGIDRIDLSAWGRVYSLSAVTLRQEQASRVSITFNGMTIQVMGMNGTPIFMRDFTAAELFGLNHIVGEPVYAGLRLEGGVGRETLIGGAGDDTLVASGGGDALEGRAGFDIADYSQFAGGVFAALDTRGLMAPAGFLDLGDVLIGVEGLTGGSGHDALYGSADANVLRGGGGGDLLSGGAGVDTLLGGDGADTLEGGAGADKLYGGLGRDMLRYASQGLALILDLLNPGRNAGAAVGDTFDGIEDVEGSAFADEISGGQDDNALWGEGGDDLLIGRGGHDWLSGGADQDRLEGGLGDDTLDGGAGVDEAVYRTDASLQIDLSRAEGLALGLGNDVLRGIEWVEAGEGHDRIIGSDAANRFIGRGGADQLFGGAGNDTLQGDGGNDWLDGGVGVDWLVFSTNLSLSINLSLAGAQDTGQGRDTLIGIENLRGGSGEDALRGTLGANHLMGEGGDDRLWGDGGGDRLEGGAGDDTLAGGLADDAFYGGSGFDVLVFSAARAVHLTLGLSGLQETGQGRDLVLGIEAAIGSAKGDVLIGDSGRNTFWGGEGADRLLGGADDDRLFGGTGADRLSGGSGADTLDGGSGADWYWAEGLASLNLRLWLTGEQQTGQGRDVLISIEHAQGGRGADRIEGSGSANILRGGAGADSLYGGAGRDRLYGEEGKDYLSGGRGADVFVFDTGEKTGRDRILDFSRKEGDRIMLKAGDYGLGDLSEAELIQTYAHKMKGGVVLDLPGPALLMIDGLRLAALDDALLLV